MIIPSPYLKPGDLEFYDEIYPAIDEKHYPRQSLIDEAILEIRDAKIRAESLGKSLIVYVSWGKDSCCLLRLVEMVGIGKITIRTPHFDQSPEQRNPCAEQVQNLYLESHDVNFSLNNDMRLWRYPEDEIALTGLRAAESTIRRLSIGKLGLTTDRVSRPIGNWSTQDVFSFCHHEGIPLPATYAMLKHGEYDRQFVRTDEIGITGHRMARKAWEEYYFPAQTRRATSMRSSRGEWADWDE